MARFHHKAFANWRALFCLGGLVMAVHSSQGQEELNDSPYYPDWSRHFRLGTVAGLGIKASFSLSGQIPVTGNDPGPTDTHAAEHFYDDGYVRVDSTGNAGNITVFWGCKSASQYSGNTITFHQTTSYETSGETKNAEGPNIGMDVVYGGLIKQWDKVRLDWDLEFGFIPISLTDNSQMSVAVNRNVYTFTTPASLALNPPSASDWAWEGSYDGESQPPLDDVATYAGTDRVEGATISGTRKLNVDLFAVSLGPTLYWDMNEWVAWSINAGPAVGFVTGEYKYDETVSLPDDSSTFNRGSIGVSKVLYGGSVSAALYVHIVENGDLYVGAKYMPLGKFDVNSAGRRAELDLSGALYVSAGFNWPF